MDPFHDKTTIPIPLPPFESDKLTIAREFLAGLEIPPFEGQNTNLLMQACIHKSYAADFHGTFAHNERLEFLGDSILSSIVAVHLFKTYPNTAESELTLYKIALVRAENLAEVAKDIGLPNVILLGNGELKNNGKEKETILCDCLEAMIGYIFLDYGRDSVEKLVKKYIVEKLALHTDISIKSYKSHLQEYIQKNHKITPLYKDTELERVNKSQDPLYQSDVYMNETLLGTGIGSNKKKAQEIAAKDAYEKLTVINENNEKVELK